MHSLSNAYILGRPPPGKVQEFYDMEEELGRCIGDHTQEQVTSPPGEEGPTEVVPAVAVQSASLNFSTQVCTTMSDPLELNKSHMRPLYPLGKEDDGETLEDKAYQGQVSESASS